MATRTFSAQKSPKNRVVVCNRMSTIPTFIAVCVIENMLGNGATSTTWYLYTTLVSLSQRRAWCPRRTTPIISAVHVDEDTVTEVDTAAIFAKYTTCNQNRSETFPKKPACYPIQWTPTFTVAPAS